MLHLLYPRDFPLILALRTSTDRGSSQCYGGITNSDRKSDFEVLNRSNNVLYFLRSRDCFCACFFTGSATHIPSLKREALALAWFTLLQHCGLAWTMRARVTDVKRVKLISLKRTKDVARIVTKLLYRVDLEQARRNNGIIC